MMHKSNTFVQYKAYKAWLQTQHGMKLKKLHTDCGEEYLFEEFTAHLKIRGTVHSLTVHDTPKENGVPEHLNHMLFEHMCAMMLASGLPKFLWIETVQHATWIKNRTAT